MPTINDRSTSGELIAKIARRLYPDAPVISLAKRLGKDRVTVARWISKGGPAWVLYALHGLIDARMMNGSIQDERALLLRTIDAGEGVSW